jgi:hypothetical protein
VSAAYWCPEDLKAFPCSGDGSVEDAVGDVAFVGVGDDDLDGVVLEALGLVDRDCVGDLERHRGDERVVVPESGARLGA